MSPLILCLSLKSSLTSPPKRDNAKAILISSCPYMEGAIDRIIFSPILSSLANSLICLSSSSVSLNAANESSFLEI